jgi:hypothetical protein
MLVLPLVSGVRIISTQRRSITGRCRLRMNSTILFGTDTFFAGYAIGK